MTALFATTSASQKGRHHRRPRAARSSPDEAYDAKVTAASALVQAMVRVQSFGTTGFREDQWEQKGRKINLKLNKGRLREAGLGKLLPEASNKPSDGGKRVVDTTI